MNPSYKTALPLVSLAVSLVALACSLLRDVSVRIPSGGVVQVSELRITDSTGRCRAKLSAESGCPELSFFSGSEDVTASFGLEAGGYPKLEMTYGDGEGGVRIALGPDNLAGIFLSRQGREAPIALGYRKDGTPVLLLCDNQNRPRLSIQTDKAGWPYALFLDGDGALLEKIPQD